MALSGIEDKQLEFEALCLNMMSDYGGAKLYELDTTQEFFNSYLKENNKQVSPTRVSKINIGKFYMIQYNYNGNKIWCPIFSIDFKIIKNKNILYAINLDYLPYIYKIRLFNKIFTFVSKIISIVILIV